MRVGFAAFTQKGQHLVDILQKADFFAEQGDFGMASFSRYDKNTASAREWVTSVFSACQALVFVGAVGIAVRLIAPHITSKETDPAVIVIDEAGRFVIPLLSGHLGGANELAERLAVLLKAQVVITTATDIHKVFAVDVWSREQGCAILDISKIKHVSASLLQGEPVGLMSDFSVEGVLPRGLTRAFAGKAGVFGEKNSVSALKDAGADLEPQGCVESTLHETAAVPSPQNGAVVARQTDEVLPRVGITLSLQTRQEPFDITLHVMPKILIAGVGCRKDISPELFEAFLLKGLASLGLSVKALQIMASIDLKKDEPCCVAFCAKYGLEFRTFSSGALQAVTGKFSSSPFVEGVTGVDNVCERSAFAAGGTRLILPKISYEGMTLALAVPPWTCRF